MKRLILLLVSIVVRLLVSVPVLAGTHSLIPIIYPGAQRTTVTGMNNKKDKPMEFFGRLFGGLLVFVYSCFDHVALPRRPLMINIIILHIIFTIAALVLMPGTVSAKSILDQEQWAYNGSHVLYIDPPNGYITFDQSVTAGMTGLLTNVEFYADVTSDRVYFFVNQSGRNDGPHLEATFVTKLAQGSGVYNIDVSAAKILLKAGDVFSIGLIGAEGNTPAGSFRAAINAQVNAYTKGALYYRYGSTGWLGLGYDDDMMFRTFVAPVQLSYFPQVAIGGGYATNFILLNNGDTTATGTLTLTDQLGNPLLVSLTELGIQAETVGYQYNSAGAVSSLPVSIAPGATLFLKAAALNPSDPTKVGWASFESYGGSIGGVAAFEFTEGGALKTTVGILSSQPVEAATIPVDNDATQKRSTAFAVANYSGEAINIRIVILDKNGIVKATITPQELNPLVPQKQVARYLDQYDASKQNFLGSMVLIAENGKRFVVAALAHNQGLYTSIPVMPGKASKIQD